MLARSTDGIWEEIERRAFANEDDLQRVLHQAFDGILLSQTGSPAVIVREVVMPDHGRIDVLAVDANGEISICECKLGSNPGSRREVIGQVLEYAGWLDAMPMREFRSKVEARLDGDLAEAMAARAPDYWDRETWLDEVGDNLAHGRFRIIIVVDELTPTLRQTVLYLNSQARLPVMAIELERGFRDDLEFLNPVVFAGEEAQRQAAEPRSGPAVEHADTVVVAAKHALAEFERTGAYICQPARSFRADTRYLGFYANRRIAAPFPAILGFRPNLAFTSETVARLHSSSDPLDQAAAEIVDTDLADPESRRPEGESCQVVLLDLDAGFELEHEIRHDGRSAWLRGQRYTSSEALQTNPTTTDELQAAGG